MSDLVHRRYRAALIVVLALIAVVLLVMLEYSSRLQRTGAGKASGTDSHSAERYPAFAIRGTLVTPLAPGVSAPLDLLIDNPGDEDMLVRRIEVVITSVSAPNSTDSLPCSLEDFHVADGNGQLTLPAGASAILSESGWSAAEQPRVGMIDSTSNQDGCKGAAVNLEYHAVGLRA